MSNTTIISNNNINATFLIVIHLTCGRNLKRTSTDEGFFLRCSFNNDFKETKMIQSKDPVWNEIVFWELSGNDLKKLKNSRTIKIECISLLNKKESKIGYIIIQLSELEMDNTR
jgi:hypothetical protein